LTKKAETKKAQPGKKSLTKKAQQKYTSYFCLKLFLSQAFFVSNTLLIFVSSF